MNTIIYPTTWSELEVILFSTCEDFISAARRIAASQSLSLTVTYKSRNSPGKEAIQHRGCLVLNCLRFDDSESPCPFEIKAFGPIDGGWKMRPILVGPQYKQNVTSLVQCNHPPEPMRNMPTTVVTNWNNFLEISFDKPDDFIDSAMHHASSLGITLRLLTVMTSDGIPKNNGRNSTYTPRGFLTLECIEANNGCPVVIKAREETDGWYLRPWRERGKGDLKGTVSYLDCKHGPENKAAFLVKLKKRDAKPKAERKIVAPKPPKPIVPPSPKKVSKKSTKAPNIATVITTNQNLVDDALNQPIIVEDSHLNVDNMLSNPLLPHLPHSHPSDIDISTSVTNHLLRYSQVDSSHLFSMDLSPTDYTDPYAPFPRSSLSNNVHIHSPIASTSSHIFSQSEGDGQNSHLHNLNHNHFPYDNLPDGSDPTVSEHNHSHSHSHLHHSHSHSHSHSSVNVSLSLPSSSLPLLLSTSPTHQLPLLPLSLLPLLPPSPEQLPLLALSPPLPLPLSVPTSSHPPPISLKRTGEPTTLQTRAAKRIRNRSTVFSGGVTGGLKTTWKRFLVALDPLGRLSSLTNSLSSQVPRIPDSTSGSSSGGGGGGGARRGVDPGTLVNWPGEEVKDFLERVAEDVPMGVKIHFRVLLAADGKKIWKDMGGKIDEGDPDELGQGEGVGSGLLG